eukprot:20850-Chlamydomonas_euryale.AAC.1
MTMCCPVRQQRLLQLVRITSARSAHHHKPATPVVVDPHSLLHARMSGALPGELRPTVSYLELLSTNQSCMTCARVVGLLSSCFTSIQTISFILYSKTPARPHGAIRMYAYMSHNLHKPSGHACFHAFAPGTASVQ